jgi:hypothetical protein
MGRSEVQQKYNMRFFLPASEIKTKSDAPTPSREGVRVVDVPERTVAVRTFSGYFRRENVDANTKALLESLKGDEEVKNVEENRVEVFGWNPPWTISFLRTNEVLVPCDFVPMKN